MTTTTAAIKTLDSTYGFVKTFAGVDAFFHRSSVQGGLTFDRLALGQTVLVDVDESAAKGPRVALMKPLPDETEE